MSGTIKGVLMTAYAFETWDVFTDNACDGNPLAVVRDAQGLSSDDMMKITREFNLSETTFILPPDDPTNTARVRIFTPGYEMPFAGHPTVGTSIAIARMRAQQGALALELKAGLFHVQVDRNGDHWRAEFLNPNLPVETGAAPSPEKLEAALSLRAGSVDRGAHKPRRCGAGVDYIYVRAPLENVAVATVNSAAFDALGLDNVVGVLLYAAGGDAPDANYHVRMFAPNAGIVEDPATGSAAAALPGQIALSEALCDGEHQWVIEQGYEMGRPSRIYARINTQDGAVTSVRIGGGAVPVMRGELNF